MSFHSLSDEIRRLNLTNDYFVKLPAKEADLNVQLSVTFVILSVEPVMLKVYLNGDVEGEQSDELSIIKFKVFPDWVYVPDSNVNPELPNEYVVSVKSRS